jgi:hypothetical protein
LSEAEGRERFFAMWVLDLLNFGSTNSILISLQERVLILIFSLRKRPSFPKDLRGAGIGAVVKLFK